MSERYELLGLVGLLQFINYLDRVNISVAASSMGYAAIRRDGGTQNCVDAMLTRSELYDTIDYAGYEALDRSIVTTIVART